MELEKKFIISISELRELMMSSWVNGWQSKKEENDVGKTDYTTKIVNELKEQS